MLYKTGVAGAKMSVLHINLFEKFHKKYINLAVNL